MYLIIAHEIAQLYFALNFDIFLIIANILDRKKKAIAKRMYA